MKLLTIFIIFTLLNNCSFDDKSGIWKNENGSPNLSKNSNQEFKTLSLSNKPFDQIINIKQNFRFKVTDPINNLKWEDIYFDQTNNFQNFQYRNLNKISFKSKKITKYNTSDYLLYQNDKVITTDLKGNIIIYSMNEKKIISKFNFYKKKYKKIDKILNIIADKNIIYVSDNIGYLYAFNFEKDKLLWAKNYKIPFRSNLKLTKDKLIAANQNNNLYFFNKYDGEIIRLIPTEETAIKNKFTNNLSLNDNLLFFLNTYGSIYAINKNSMKIIWFLNLNQSFDINPSNLFSSNQIINSDNKIVISTNQFTYIIDSKNGAILHKKKFSSQVKPIIIDDYLFLITKKNYLVAVALKDGKTIYSYNIDDKITKFLKTKKKKGLELKKITIVNNEILIFLKNSFILKFDLYGNLEDLKKLPSKIKSNPIFIDRSIFYIDNKRRLSIID